MAYETYSRAALALIRLFFIKFFTTKVYVVAKSAAITCLLSDQNNQGDQMFFPKNRSFFRQKSQVLSQENYQLQQKSQVFRKISQVFRETDVLKKALFRTESSPAEESTYACSFFCMHMWILPRDFFRSEIVPSLGRPYVSLKMITRLEHGFS